MHCRAKYLLWAVIAALALAGSGCGARGNLYLPEKNQEQKR